MPNEGSSFEGETSTSFGDVLADLKDSGCNLLVTGAVAEDVTARATRKLLGTPTEPRERVLAVTDSVVEETVTYLPGSLYPHHDGIEILDYRDVGRSAGTAERSNSPVDRSNRDPAKRSDGGTARPLTDIGSDLQNTVRRRGRDTEPAELRFGLVSLRPLLDQHDAETVQTFVEGLTDAVLDTRGMAHYHLRMPDDDPMVAELAPLFDARIELRKLEGMIPEQRWHVPGADTDWVTL